MGQHVHPLQEAPSDRLQPASHSTQKRDTCRTCFEREEPLGSAAFASGPLSKSPQHDHSGRGLERTSPQCTPQNPLKVCTARLIAGRPCLLLQYFGAWSVGYHIPNTLSAHVALSAKLSVLPSMPSSDHQAWTGRELDATAGHASTVDTRNAVCQSHTQPRTPRGPSPASDH